MSIDRSRSTSLRTPAGGGNDGLRRSKSASTIKEEKQKESKGHILSFVYSSNLVSGYPGFLSARGEKDKEGKGKEDTKGSEPVFRSKRAPSPRFDKEEFYEQEAKLTQHERRLR
jgi:hypothetical protein